MKNEKSVISNGRKLMFAALLIFALAAGAAAQTVIFKQGNTVQTPDGRIGVIESFKNQEMAKVKFGENDSQYFMLTSLKIVPPPKPPRTEPPENFRVGDMVEDANGKQYRIESISGNKAKLRFGVGRYNVRDELLENLVSVKMAAVKREREVAQKVVRAGFEDEAQPFTEMVASLAHAYNPKFRQNASFEDAPATYERWRKELETLYAVCQKYPNLTNQPGADQGNIRQNVGDWCGMAEQRTAVLKRMKLTVGEMQVGQEVHRWKLDLDEALRHPEGEVRDGLQMLLYDRAAWEQMELQIAKKKFTDLGETIPPKLLALLDEKVAELKARIERDALTRSWTQPKYTDAASEAMVKKSYPAQYPGVKVYKTGMTFTTWKAMDDTSLVGSGIGYKLYRTTKGAYRYKLGLALVKLPNQPFCQIRDFQVQQNKSGAGYSAAKLALPHGYTGIFVKCP